jgi:hypothetical protein
MPWTTKEKGIPYLSPNARWIKPSSGKHRKPPRGQICGRLWACGCIDQQ